MKSNSKPNFILIMFTAFLFKSCLFGVGLIEEKLSDNIWLIAMNDYHEASIYYTVDDSSVKKLLVPETVFEVGFNNDFIIAKSHPKNDQKEINKSITHYYIIELNTINENAIFEISPLPEIEFKNKLREYDIAGDLKFSMQIEKNK